MTVPPTELEALRAEMLELMSAWSEDVWAAGWMSGTILGRSFGWPSGYEHDKDFRWLTWDEASALFAERKAARRGATLRGGRHG